MYRTSALRLSAAALFLTTALRSEAGLPTVTEFDPKDDKMDWRVVDDGVMGGLSKGKLQITDDGILRFSGNLSLENNGGFSSLRTDKVDLDLSQAEGLVARVKGDGRTYQMRFGTDARFRGMEVSFRSEFETKKGKWVEVKVPFDSFEGNFRGMQLKDERFDPAKVRRVGLLLGDKKSGPFELEVDWIRTYGAEDDDIVAKAVADGRFKTLAAALKQAELVETLKGSGPFTVFAPTDKAFSKLPKGTVEDLLKPENADKLAAILKFHVIAGSVDLATALKAGSGETILGENVTIGFSNGRVRVNDAKLLDADVRGSNGVIHVIDSVLLPPTPKNDIASVAKRSGKFGTLLAAVEAAGFSEVLKSEGPITVLAPSDEAFKALPKGTVESLLKEENREQLRAILSLHAIEGKVSAGDALNAGNAKAVGGGALKFSIDGGSFKVNGATIVKTDIACDNGIIHVIDKVLLPKKKEASAKQSTETRSSAERIEAAIDKGVPIFNSGDHEACAKIYRDCLVGLMKDGDLNSGVRGALGELIERADTMEPTERAWVLRHGMDRLYSALNH